MPSGLDAQFLRAYTLGVICMSNGFVLSIIFAVFGLVMAWLSLDLSCAHFDVAGMCRNLSESMSVKEIENLRIELEFKK